VFKKFSTTTLIIVNSDVLMTIVYRRYRFTI